MGNIKALNLAVVRPMTVEVTDWLTHAEPIQSANAVSTVLLPGSPSSVMRFLTHKDLYEATDSSCVSIRFQPRVFRFYSTEGASSRYYISSLFFPISLHWCSCT
jgi:hypothetical protein